jgi:hypothetical protein
MSKPEHGTEESSREVGGLASRKFAQFADKDRPGAIREFRELARRIPFE